MALFGKKKRKSPFDMPSQGMPQQQSMGAPGHGFEEPKSGPDWGGIAMNVGGNIADAISRYYGGAPVYAQSQALQQRAALLAQQQRAASMRQAAQNEEWYRREQYKRDNPMPTNNDTVADYEFIREQIGEDQAKEFLRNKANPPQYRVGPDGQFYRIDTGGSAPPTAPVGKLTPIEPTTQNTPAPQIGANGFPNQLTADQYQATVNAMGQSETDAWMRRNGIRVAN